MRLIILIIVNALFVFICLLLIPLYKEKIKPNKIYGLRTKATLSNEQVWYQANKYSAKLFFIALPVVNLVSFLCFLLIKNRNTFFITLFSILIFTLIILTILSVIYANKIGKNLPKNIDISKMKPKNLKLILLIIFLLATMIIIAISIPLFNQSIKQNSVYGLRIEQTMKNESVWFSANKYMAELFIIFGSINIVLLIALFFIIKKETVYLIISVILFLLLISTTAILSISKAKDLYKEVKVVEQN